MIEHDAFLATVMEQPYEMGPLLVWADWLQDRGDPRGEFLALLPEIVKAIKVLPTEPGATYSERTDAIKLLRTDPLRRLFAALQARFTPLSDGRTVGDLQQDPGSRMFVTASLLNAAGLVEAKELAARAARAAEADEAAWTAEAAGSAEAARAAWDAGSAWAAWAAWSAEAARDAEAAADWAAEYSAYRWQLNLAVWISSRTPLPTRVRRLLRTIHSGVHA